MNKMKSILTVVLALAIGLLAFPAHAQTARGGASRLMEMNRINTPAQAEALKPGDAIAMACKKCESLTVMIVTRDSKHHTKMIPGEKHLCPGCKSTIEVVGHGKAKTDVVKHVCKACGDESAFCCATTPGSGATPGMKN
jgi:hypothetical protein